MRLSKLMASIGTAALLLSACGGEPETPEANAPAPAPAPAPTQKPQQPKPAEAEPFENPVVPGTPKDPTSIANLGLLEPSDPDKVVKQVEQGKDPFGIITVEQEPADTKRTGAKIPALDPRTVSSPPKLPKEIGPKIEENIDVEVRPLPTLEARNIPPVPDLPPVSPDGELGLIPTRVKSRPQIPPPPPQETQQVPDLAGLPTEFGPPQPGSQPGSQPASQPASQPFSQPGSQPFSQPFSQEPRQVPDITGPPADFGPALPTGSPGDGSAGQGYRPGRRPSGTPGQSFGPGSGSPIAQSPGEGLRPDSGSPIAQSPGEGFKPDSGSPIAQSPGEGLRPDPVSPNGQAPGEGLRPDPGSPSGETPGQPDSGSPNSESPGEGFKPDSGSPNGQSPGQSFGPDGVPPGDGIPPQPLSIELAQNVEVSGIIQVGRDIQIILKAPNEQTTRYVKVGQRIANGEVLVKRVEELEDSEPVVILEQNGIEVRKVVGEQPITEESSQ